MKKKTTIDNHLKQFKHTKDVITYVLKENDRHEVIESDGKRYVVGKDGVRKLIPEQK